VRVPHIRIEAPEGYAGKVMTARGVKAFIKLPDQEEFELVGIRGFTGNMHVDDVGIVTLEFLASYEVNQQHDDIEVVEIETEGSG